MLGALVAIAKEPALWLPTAIMVAVLGLVLSVRGTGGTAK
jgi:hypothetical protein